MIKMYDSKAGQRKSNSNIGEVLQSLSTEGRWNLQVDEEF